MKLPAIFQVDPIARMLAQTMRTDPEKWAIHDSVWEYNERLQLNPRTFEVTWPAARKFNLVSRNHLRSAAGEVILHHERIAAKKATEDEEKRMGKLWEALLSHEAPTTPKAKAAQEHQAAIQTLGAMNSSAGLGAMNMTGGLGGGVGAGAHQHNMGPLQGMNPFGVSGLTSDYTTQSAMADFYREVERRQSAFEQECRKRMAKSWPPRIGEPL